MFRPHEGARLYTRVLLESQEGRGVGMFAKDAISCGATIVDEIPAIVGPKQTSPLVCMECLSPLSLQGQNTSIPNTQYESTEKKVENAVAFPQMEQCKDCGMPLCSRCCIKLEEEKIVDTEYFHFDECQLFQNAGFTNSKIESINSENIKAVKQLYAILAPLRLLVRSKKNPGLLDLEDMAEARKNTLLYHFNAMNVVKKIQNILKLQPTNGYGETFFTAEEIHKACGILDTNAYELSWNGSQGDGKCEDPFDGIRGRALFPLISRINHDCSPNCRKFFSSDKSQGGEGYITMIVKAARDIEPGEELTISYTPPLFNTTVRQVILTQTKNFVCSCKRCLDPTEFGSCLSGLKCRDCNNNNGSVLEKDPNIGVLLPIHPTKTNSDLICDICKSIMPSERAKMEVDTVLKFVGQGEEEESLSYNETLETMSRVGRFLAPTHQIIMDLKLRFISQIEKQGNEFELLAETKDILEIFLGDILEVLAKIAPGQSTIRGSISKRYHLLNDKFGLKLKHSSGNEDTILSKETVEKMFKHDIKFAANQVVDTKDLR